MTRWRNLAHFQKWADYITALAAKTPNEPIPSEVILITPPDETYITKEDIKWAEATIKRLMRKQQ